MPGDRRTVIAQSRDDGICYALGGTGFRWIFNPKATGCALLAQRPAVNLNVREWGSV